MLTKRFQTAALGLIATIALGSVAMVAVFAASADAAGLRNCVEILGPQSGRAGCYELVWIDGVQRRMVFSNQTIDGAQPQELDAFYVLAPQSDAPQGYPPNTFPHDHVVRDAPAGNHGAYSAKLQGYFVICSGPAIESGACVPAVTNVGAPDPLPLVHTVNGQTLTSAEAIESAAAAGLVVPINLGPGAVLVGTLSGR
jgi:hypothetical protein